MIYPDLCFTEDVCAIVWESTENNINASEAEDGGGSIWPGTDEKMDGSQMAETNSQSGGAGQFEMFDAGSAKGKDMFTGLCEAKPGQIKLKSRFLEIFQSESKGNSNGVKKE